MIHPHLDGVLISRNWSNFHSCVDIETILVVDAPTEDKRKDRRHVGVEVATEIAADTIRWRPGCEGRVLGLRGRIQRIALQFSSEGKSDVEVDGDTRDLVLKIVPVNQLDTAQMIHSSNTDVGFLGWFLGSFYKGADNPLA